MASPSAELSILIAASDSTRDDTVAVYSLRNCTVSASHALQVAVLLSLSVLSATALADKDKRSQTDAATVQHGSPPVAVLRTDELYKPARLQDGRLIAVSLPTIEDVQRTTAIYSTDSGRTWSEPSKLFNLPREEGSFGYYDFLVDRAGEMHFFFLLDPSKGTRRRQNSSPAPVPEAELDIYYVRSTHNRTKWESPSCIWKGRAGDLLSVIQLRNGRLLLPISYRTSRNWANRGDGFDSYTYSGQFDSSALYSDDNGDTWKQSVSVLRTPTPDIETIEGAVEPVVLQLKDGRVWMLIRTQMGRFYESFSVDDGKTWSAALPTSLIASDAPAGLVRLSDGRIVMILNRSLRFPYAYGGRHMLHAAISDDDGRTWHAYREVVRDPLRGQPPPPSGDFGPAYPYPAVSRDDKIIFAVACATGTRGGQPENPRGFVPTQKRDLILLDPAWLNETAQHTDFSQGLEDWSVFGVKGVEWTTHPTRLSAHVLSIRKTEPTWPAAAVWNFPMGTRGHLRISLLLKPGFAGAVVGLTDHYSVPYDSEDIFHNVFNFPIGVNGELSEGRKLDSDRWYHIDLKWDTAAGNSQIHVDGHPVAILRAKRESEGISYLRLRSTVSNTDLAGLLVESVSVDIEQ
jgi:hypothetical protein